MQKHKVCLTFCFNRGWRYGTCGTRAGKNCIHNPTFEPRKLVMGDVRKGRKLVLAVSFRSSPLPCTFEILSKNTAIEICIRILVHIPLSNPQFHNRSVPSWEEQSVWMRDHTHCGGPGAPQTSVDLRSSANPF